MTTATQAVGRAGDCARRILEMDTSTLFTRLWYLRALSVPPQTPESCPTIATAHSAGSAINAVLFPLHSGNSDHSPEFPSADAHCRIQPAPAQFPGQCASPHPPGSN